MTQKFVFGQPVNMEALASVFIRNNLDSIGSLNAGNQAPTNPQTGMPWLDTSNAPTSLQLKVFVSNAWRTIAEYPAVTGAINAVRLVVGSAQQTWTLLHNLNKSTVSVTLFDLADDEIEPLNIDVTDPNQAVVQHAVPIAGSALVLG